MNHCPYEIDRRSPLAAASALCMALSAGIRLFYFIRTGCTPWEFVFHLMLPILSALLFVYVVVFAGRERLGLTTLSVLLGVVFFIVKALTFTTLIHTLLCIGLYLVVLILYTLTLFGRIPTKKLLYPLFSFPLLYHIFVEDMKLYILATPPVPFLEWLPEISVLLIMTGLLCLSVGMKKKT